ncbi:MAG: TIGR01244 family phosphatase [Burkholderiales bacterium]|nr:TIGR01244 family phosphatase [Burkholderiales bacterium]MDE2076450.1 TIGR01244 family phosphatase [Burkholderiales bacterium]MDE2431518.1 TIGR01244 family phosphatase [Burkholderiales bacterium]HET8693654.1 TIGR01244 family sulfur transferase [Aquabacterium sp.]
MSLSVPINPLCPEFAVCGQISVEDVAKLATQGYRSIINNRPDGEGGPGQPTSAQIEAAAKAAGMSYVHFPVASLMISPEQVTRYHALCADLPHPIVAFCKSGGRANALFQAVGCQVGRPA